eukprot:s1298_g13.t1
MRWGPLLEAALMTWCRRRENVDDRCAAAKFHLRAAIRVGLASSNVRSGDTVGISTDDVWTLFMLLDSDMTGLLDIDDFVNGCMQLRGPAKSLQVAKMSYENKLTRSAIRDVVKELAAMKARLEQIRHKMKRNNDAENHDNVSVAL